MGEFAAKPTTQLAVQRPSAPTISVMILQIIINRINLEPGRFSVQKARMNHQLREFLTATQTVHSPPLLNDTSINKQKAEGKKHVLSPGSQHSKLTD